jgi:hypothetical protein
VSKFSAESLFCGPAFDALHEYIIASNKKEPWEVTLKEHIAYCSTLGI